LRQSRKKVRKDKIIEKRLRKMTGYEGGHALAQAYNNQPIFRE